MGTNSSKESEREEQQREIQAMKARAETKEREKEEKEAMKKYELNMYVERHVPVLLELVERVSKIPKLLDDKSYIEEAVFRYNIFYFQY